MMWSPSRGLIAFSIVSGILTSIIMLTLLIRFGLVAFLAALSFNLLGYYPTTTDASAPYFMVGLVPVFTTLVLALYGFRVALGGQPLFRDDLLGVAPAGRETR